MEYTLEELYRGIYPDDDGGTAKVWDAEECIY